MNIDQQNIDYYLQRFFDGNTSNKEEEAIYRYFATAKLPRHLRRYKKMFAWYAQQMPYDPATTISLKRKKRERGIFAGIAAAIAMVLATASITLYHNSRLVEQAYQTYAGSYMIINGKKIDDLRVILPKIHEIEQHISENMACLETDNPDHYAALHSDAMRLLLNDDFIVEP